MKRRILYLDNPRNPPVFVHIAWSNRIESKILNMLHFGARYCSTYTSFWPAWHDNFFAFALKVGLTQPVQSTSKLVVSHPQRQPFLFVIVFHYERVNVWGGGFFFRQKAFTSGSLDVWNISWNRQILRSYRWQNSAFLSAFRVISSHINEEGDSWCGYKVELRTVVNARRTLFSSSFHPVAVSHFANDLTALSFTLNCTDNSGDVVNSCSL